VKEKEAKLEYGAALEDVNEDLHVLSEKEIEFLPISPPEHTSTSPARRSERWQRASSSKNKSSTGPYTDEQRAKEQFAAKNPGQWNPYGALPQMRLLTYQMPEELLAVASAGEFNEFDLNEFFAATGTEKASQFKHKSDVQKWLDIIRGQHIPKEVEGLKVGSRPPFPYSDVRLLPYLQHSFWFPTECSCLLCNEEPAGREAQHLLAGIHGHRGGGRVGRHRPGGTTSRARRHWGRIRDQNHYAVMRQADTGITVPQWSSILMLRNLKSPETYFQAAFRVAVPLVYQESGMATIPTRKKP